MGLSADYQTDYTGFYGVATVTRTRTEAESPETFTYRDPDQGWSGGPSEAPLNPQAARHPR
jgi:hypothetical protein